LLSFQAELEPAIQVSGSEETDEQIKAFLQSERKMFEIVTDMPGSMAMKPKGGTEGAPNTRGILGGVLGWEYLLGEMFESDHVSAGMEGMRLFQECIGGQGSPVGIADVFFQRFCHNFPAKSSCLHLLHSGPVGSKEFSQPWLFEAYLPAVMVCY
jgi:hypothetical protein